MLSDELLIVEVRRLAKINQRLPILLLLGHLQRPAKTRDVLDKGVAIGFRAIKNWNVTDILKQASNASHVAQRSDGWVLLDPGVAALRSVGAELGSNRVVAPSDSVLPRELFGDTRGYIEKVVAQINGSYDCSMHDCCAVMCRRLGETLIIEVYEALGRAQEIKAHDGNFLMFNGLLGVLFKDASINLGRNSKKGLEELKELGDKSAHNRRFNARQTDIDGIKTGLRTAAEELLHLAKLPA